MEKAEQPKPELQKLKESKVRDLVIKNMKKKIMKTNRVDNGKHH